MRCPVHLDGEQHAPVHRRGERLRAAHPAEAGGEHEPAGERAAEVLARRLGEGLVGALQDALGADVDPGARGHLAVHHQALALELVEVLPGGPGGHQVRVRDQHARARPRGCGRRRPACPTAPAASRRRRARAARARSRRSTPSCAPPCRCRRRRPGPAGARPPRGRGCSSACAAPLPAASRCRRACVPRGARTDASLARHRYSSVPQAASAAARTAPERARPASASISGESVRSWPCAGTCVAHERVNGLERRRRAQRPAELERLGTRRAARSPARARRSPRRARPSRPRSVPSRRGLPCPPRSGSSRRSRGGRAPCSRRRAPRR